MPLISNLKVLIRPGVFFKGSVAAALIIAILTGALHKGAELSVQWVWNWFDQKSSFKIETSTKPTPAMDLSPKGPTTSVAPEHPAAQIPAPPTPRQLSTPSRTDIEARQNDLSPPPRFEPDYAVVPNGLKPMRPLDSADPK